MARQSMVEQRWGMAGRSPSKFVSEIESLGGTVFNLHNGDCAEVMASMEADSVDAIVTDPPYGLAFMGAKWDSPQMMGSAAFLKSGGGYGNYPKGTRRTGYADVDVHRFQAYMTPIFEEALRVAKPGAHMLCFGGTRTFHRLTCAIEDAGWEIRDCIMWVYGSGFPKSMDVGKAIDKALGAERKKVPATGGLTNNRNLNDDNWSKIGQSNPMMDGPEPATAAAAWDGWGTCLKPAWEPIIVARKPLDGTVAHNVMTHGVGAINIDGCRVGIAPDDDVFAKNPHTHSKGKDSGIFGVYKEQDGNWSGDKGRFPANLVHDGSQMVLDLFPDTGKSSGGGMHTRGTAGEETTNTYGTYTGGMATKSVGMGDSGSAARFFYCAKASKKDRGEGNDHPTVKPNALMRWLVRLVCPQGGVVLDPFMGSGSTGVACVDEGMSFVGIDLDPHYCEIANRRIGDEVG